MLLRSLCQCLRRILWASIRQFLFELRIPTLEGRGVCQLMYL
ncbi:hypothetical protein COO91_07960 [Nostoc flagelliforme CCNUN1]|uniref:Uncharacterized protein n=1 Tax=Nostoc flagelliforme CCNUN1 TaxID=2038116 RepID=A0A2K8T2E6_9NOSO|nr:hypothetical protein COO91_07960 [Nostoc flagelliforme CCNUN1]